MKFLKAWTVLASMGAAAPALAQEPAFLRLDPNATRHVFAEGTVITPSSSIPQPGPGAVNAHTNVHLFQPLGMPTITNRTARPAAGPPAPGLYFETPESIACLSLRECGPRLQSQHRYRGAERRWPDHRDRRRL